MRRAYPPSSIWFRHDSASSSSVSPVSPEHRLDDVVEQLRAVEQGELSPSPEKPELAVDVPEDSAPLGAPDDVAEGDTSARQTQLAC